MAQPLGEDRCLSRPPGEEAMDSGALERITSRAEDRLDSLRQMVIDGSLSADRVAMAVDDLSIVLGELHVASEEIQEKNDRRPAEEAQRQSEERLRMVVDNIPVILNALDEQGNLVAWNKEWERVLGYSAEGAETAAFPVEQVYPDPAYRQWMLDAWRKHNGDFRDFEVDVACKDGTVRTISWSSIAKKCVIPGWATWNVGVDVTKRKRAEQAERDQRVLAEALRDSAAALASMLSLEETLDRILDEIGRVLPHEGALILLLEGETARTVRWRGYGGRHLGDWLSQHTFQLADFPRLRYMHDTRRAHIVSDTHNDPLGAPVTERSSPASAVGAPLVSKGKVLGFIELDSPVPGFYEQVHADRLQSFAHQAAVAIENARLYEDVSRHATELEARVAIRTAELSQREASLRDTNLRLTELDQLKSQFVSTVSHELRTPLSNIKIYLDLLENGKPEKRSRYMATMHRETELLQSLIEDLLQLSRLDLGKVQPILQNVDVAKLAQSLVNDRTTLVSQRGLALRIQQPDEPQLVLADPRMLVQVFSNLLTNATNYTPDGGEISVRVGRHIGADEDGWVKIEVKDTGLGIPPEDRPLIFERFYRGYAARQSRVPGTGLGLSICEEIIKRHGGRIAVDSVVGQGTTFTVWLPAADD